MVSFPHNPHNPLVVITGPTATGKTALAVELAARYNAEIVSADSRQVYRLLDIGTAKPTRQEQTAAVHHLLDVVDLDEPFDAARFRSLALAAIQDIRRRGKNVFVVGGTGLYVQALLRGLFPSPPADPALRARLQQQQQTNGAGFLHAWLERVDPDAAKRIHPNDSVRLIRALEVLLVSGTPISQWQRAHGFRERLFDTVWIGLAVDRETLRQRIAQRCHDMVREGLIDELRQIWALGYRPDLPVLQTIGYAQMRQFLEGTLSLAQAIEEMAKQTRRLAKRQLTWFRAEPELSWFAPSQRAEIGTAIERFFDKGNMRADNVFGF